LNIISRIFPEGSGIGDKHMVPTLKALAGATMIAAGWQAGISLPRVLALFRAAKMGLDRINVSAPAVIEAMVDWLEAAYGGPIDPR
jgi:hypothetical protein